MLVCIILFYSSTWGRSILIIESTTSPPEFMIYMSGAFFGLDVAGFELYLTASFELGSSYNLFKGDDSSLSNYFIAMSDFKLDRTFRLIPWSLSPSIYLFDKDLFWKIVFSSNTLFSNYQSVPEAAGLLPKANTFIFESLLLCWSYSLWNWPATILFMFSDNSPSLLFENSRESSLKLYSSCDF